MRGFFDTLLDLVALKCFDSSHHAIVSLILKSTSIHIHPYAMPPYRLYSIPGILQQSGLEQLRAILALSATITGAMGNCCFGRDKEVGMADVSFIRCAENELTEGSDTSLHAFSSIK